MAIELKKEPLSFSFDYKRKTIHDEKMSIFERATISVVATICMVGILFSINNRIERAEKGLPTIAETVKASFAEQFIFSENDSFAIQSSLNKKEGKELYGK